ncbi:MAG: DNA polymerase III subunit delta [Saprospiraceae bacterium]|nr:DNA polymerase III subunit delta [Saprospiraceae bacterium]
MDYNKLYKEWKANKPAHASLLAGEEPYFMDQLTEIAESVFIPEAEKDFNQLVLYGKDVSAKIIVETCRQYPFMGTRKLVIVKEAQDIKDWEILDNYLKNPVPTSILILVFKNKKPDGRSAWVKTMKEKHVFFESKPLYDHQLPAFISELAAELNLKFDPEAIALFAEFVGNDLGQIRNEMDKIKINFDKGVVITKDIISELIGVSKEYNVFELCKAFSKRDVLKTIRIARNLALHIKSNPLVLSIGSVYNHFNKIWATKIYAAKSDQELMSILKIPFIGFVKEYREAANQYSTAELENIFHQLKIYDLKSKGLHSGNTSQENLLMEMVISIHHSHK